MRGGEERRARPIEMGGCREKRRKAMGRGKGRRWSRNKGDGIRERGGGTLLHRTLSPAAPPIKLDERADVERKEEKQWDEGRVMGAMALLTSDLPPPS